MNDFNYMSEEEEEVLSENVDEIVADMRQGGGSPQELQDILHLLNVSIKNFDKVKAETWFKKAWILISGKRGELTEISINNLSKIQLGVLKLLGEIFKDSSGIKNDLREVFGNIEQIKKQSLVLRTIILRFNEKYEKQFQKLQGEIEKTRQSVRLSQFALGFTCIIGAVLVFSPGLSEQYWQYGLAVGGVAGTFLIAQVIIGSRKGKKIPISLRVAKGTTLSPESQQAVKQACQFLGLEGTVEKANEDTRVFKIDNRIHDLMDYFKLTGEEQRFLFSMQYFLCYADCEKTMDHDLKKEKSDWLEAWRQLVEGRLDNPLVTNSDVLFRGLNEVRKERISLPKMGVILFEVSLFNPYFSLGSNGSKQKLFHDRTTYQEQINKICGQLGFPIRLIKEAENVNEEALKEIPKKGFFEELWRIVTENPYKILAGAIFLAITGGIAAPLIGGTIGTAMGLSGAAAINAGLAFLGGGAIAAGGFGMAGGTAVLIGGGAILGAGAAGSMASLFSSSRYLVLRELAKMEAIAKVFLNSLNNGKEAIQKVIEHEKNTAREFEEAAKVAADKNKRKELNAEVLLCSKAVERLKHFIDEPF